MASRQGSEHPAPTGTNSHPQRGRTLLLFSASTYLALLLNSAGFLQHGRSGAIPALFLSAAWLDSCFQYLLLALLPVFALHLLLSWSERRRGRWPSAEIALWALAWLFSSAAQVALYADRRIYEIFGFHINGFVLNLLETPGGVASMGGDRRSTLLFSAIALGFAALQGSLLVLSLRGARRESAPLRWLPPRRVVALVLALLLVTAAERFGYAVSHLRGYTPVLDSATVLPLYRPVTMRSLAQRLGIATRGEGTPRFHMDEGTLHYPLAPLVRPVPRHLNLVWLVAESLRADMLDPTIMPRTWAFAQGAIRFLHHYSGGNGTRMGMFSMFYGLYGSYWFPFLHHRRPPVLMDLLWKDGYQLSLYTSAKFSYPEFDKTIFAGVAPQHLHEFSKGEGWQRDRHNVRDWLDFIDHRDPRRPFMTFLFFESPHARYYFPPESVIRRPYLPDLSYATMDLQRDIELIRNRYINACHHLDSQLGRILDELRRRRLLDSTMVVITGDHGEAFLEKGRWGHGSDFSEEQTRVPLVLWLPGQAPRLVERMTSHLDIPATLLHQLGVRNPPEDYSLGFDLLGPRQRETAVIADWNDVAVVGRDFKLVVPLNAAGYLRRHSATTQDDQPLPPARGRAILAEHQRDWLEVMAGLGRFTGSG